MSENIPTISSVIEAFKARLTADVDDMEAFERNSEFALLRMLQALQSNNMFVVDTVDWFRFEGRVLAPVNRGKLVTIPDFEACLWNLIKISEIFWDVLVDMESSEPITDEEDE